MYMDNEEPKAMNKLKFLTTVVKRATQSLPQSHLQSLLEDESSTKYLD